MLFNPCTLGDDLYDARVTFTSSLSGIPAASSMTFNMLLVTNWKSSTKVWTIINEELS